MQPGPAERDAPAHAPAPGRSSLEGALAWRAAATAPPDRLDTDTGVPHASTPPRRRPDGSCRDGRPDGWAPRRCWPVTAMSVSVDMSGRAWRRPSTSCCCTPPGRPPCAWTCPACGQRPRSPTILSRPAQEPPGWPRDQSAKSGRAGPVPPAAGQQGARRRLRSGGDERAHVGGRASAPGWVGRWVLGSPSAASVSLAGARVRPGGVPGARVPQRFGESVASRQVSRRSGLAPRRGRCHRWTRTGVGIR